MKTVIDNLDSTTGWTASTGCAIHGLNDTSLNIAGDLAHSLVLSFPVAGYCTKTLTPVTLGLNNRITFSIWSQKFGGVHYDKYTDFEYKIKFGTSKEYYLPVYSLMNDVTFDVSDLTTIEEITITKTGAGADYLIISYMVMSRDELPYDIFAGLKERFDAFILSKHNTKYTVGTMASGIVGDKTILLEDDPIFAHRYSKIMITDGVHTEYHHIDIKNEHVLHLSSLYDGPALLYTYGSGATVYLCVPFEFGRTETDLVLPSINVWGLAPEATPIESDIQTENNTWKSTGTVNERSYGSWFKYPLIIDCESNNTETLALASEVCRTILAQEYFWCNGRKFAIDFNGPAFQVDAVEANDIDKVQYMAVVSVNEDVWDNVRLPITTTVNITATPSLD